MRTECSGEAFVCPPGDLSRIVTAAVRRVTGREPKLSTSGGTSDARFIKDICQVCEFGMPGGTAAHKSTKRDTRRHRGAHHIYQSLKDFLAKAPAC